MSYEEDLRRIRYNYEGRTKSVLDRSLETLLQLGVGYMTKQDALEKEAKQDDVLREKFAMQVRSGEIQRLTGLHPDIDPNDFNDPWGNASNYKSYLAEIKLKKNATNSAVEYNPPGGIISPEAEQDLFTYGAGRFSLDNTATILSVDDLYNYDAWLLGGIGTLEGKKIAQRHNWNGLLNDYNEDYDGYVLDEDDYIDLKEKGLIDVIEPHFSTPELYVLNEEQKTQIIKKYEYWKKAFIGSKQLKSRSQISSMISQNNIANAEKLNKLHEMDQYKAAIENISTWRPHSEKSTFNLVDDNDKFTTDYINEDGEQEQRSISKNKFIKEFPHVYQWLYTNTNIESAMQEYFANPELQAELSRMPIIEAKFTQQIKDFHSIEQGKRNLGITNTQDEWILDSRIMGDARDIVLEDLHEIGNGILFNEAALVELASNPQTANQITMYMDKLKELEAGYVDETSMHYNPDVARFLSIYGFGANAPAMTLNNLLDELKLEVPGRK